MLTPRADCVQEVVGPWFLVAVQGRYEKVLAWELHDNHADYFLPLAERVDRSRHKTMQVLFPGYIFAAGTAAEEICRDCRAVFDIQPIGNQRRFVKEIANIQIALHADPSLDVVEVNNKGQRVIVNHGPFEGIQGTVENFHNAKGIVRVYIEVEIMGRSLILDVDRTDLGPL